MTRSWHAIYRNFDDDALATLASAGLLRRAAKDVEAGKVDWLNPPNESGGSVYADGQVVSLGEDGPKQAQCDCPAPGICKHILAAVLWLRDLPVERILPASQEQGGGAVLLSVTDEIRSNVADEVLGLDLATVFKLAGRAAIRQAAEILTQPERVTITGQNGSLLISFEQSASTCRYIGGTGFAGIVSEIAPAMRPALHLAAVLAVWRHHGQLFEWPDGIGKPLNPETDRALSASEKQFLLQIRQLLFEVCETGVSHVSAILDEQIRAINMSARSHELPRLASMLRTLASTISLLAKRDYHADERQLIRLMARIYALCAALDQANTNTLSVLRGRLQREFSNSSNLDLLPLGAYWWENRNGARGLTVSFWESKTQRIVQSVLARPDGSDTAFDKKSSWSRHNLWQGASSVDRVCEGSLQLTSARLSDDSRIAIGGDTRATPGEPWLIKDPRWENAGFDDWLTLGNALRAGAGLTGEPFDCVLLRPRSIKPPRLDEVRQVFEWQLVDSRGNRLSLQLQCEERYRCRIENLERLARDIPNLQGVVARIDRGFRNLTLEPVALLLADNNRLKSISFDFASTADNMQPLPLLGRILRLLKENRLPSIPSTSSVSARLLMPVLTLLECKLMTGRMLLDETERESLERYRDAIRSVGLDLIVQTIDQYLAMPNSDQTLRLAYLCMTCAELDTAI